MKYPVNIDAGNALVEKLQKNLNVGGFASSMPIPKLDKRQRLIMSTDGVGTKVMVASENTIGIDLVAMCVNDVVCTGAKPYYFLDYYATGKLDVDDAHKVIMGIKHGCDVAGCELVGGETAEMPGMYNDGQFDLAGFCVGFVDERDMWGSHKVQEGDLILGLQSSGPHSNGYSLLNKHNWSNIQDLLEPTKIYVNSLLSLGRMVDVHAVAHITGGGILDNVKRVIPDGLCARIHERAWDRPAYWDEIKTKTQLSTMEMLHVFNNGIGMIVIVPEKDAKFAHEALNTFGETCYVIGNVTTNKKHKVEILGVIDA